LGSIDLALHKRRFSNQLRLYFREAKEQTEQ